MIVKGKHGYKFKLDLIDHGPVVLVKFTMLGPEMLGMGDGHGFEIPILREHLKEYLLKIRVLQNEPKERAIYN